jgi:hypothetical protein
MNTYNENLRAIVFDSIQSREMDKKKLNAQLNSSKVSLYYAQGESISATEKLQLASEKLAFKGKIKQQTVENANLGSNVQASVNQQKQYSDASVTNVATCAANVQVAANAILKLASDVGSIFSIVNAADYGADIYANAEDVKKLIDKTAYDSEKASQMAMQASAYTAEIAYNKVLSQVELVNAELKAIHETALKEYESMAAEVTVDNNTLANDYNKEQLAEGNQKDILTDYNAAVEAYTFFNKQLNLDLTVSPKYNTNFTVGVKKPKALEVRFSALQNPFESIGNKEAIVRSYFLLLVKNSKRKTFSIEDAEALVHNPEVDSKTKKKHFISIPVSGKKDKKVHQAEIELSEILDADGDEFAPGENYVIFVFAEYEESYKRVLNDFENFITSPSEVFSLPLELEGPDAKFIKVTSSEIDFQSAKEMKVDLEQSDQGTVIHLKKGSGDDDLLVSSTLSFKTDSNDETTPVKYRCMFLPVSATNNAKYATPSFIFDLDLAEQISAANYFAPVRVSAEKATKKSGENDVQWQLHLHSNITDNFGVPLIPGEKYIPVILTVTDAPEIEQDQYANALSDIQKTEYFTYKTIIDKN